MDSDRRAFLKSTAAIAGMGQSYGSFSRPSWRSGPVAHLIPSASHRQVSIKVIFSRRVVRPQLGIDGRYITGEPTDTEGVGFSFDAEKLKSGTEYELNLLEDGQPITDSWPLTTQPAPHSKPDHLRLLVFTCGGGHPLMSEGQDSVFLPQTTRRRLLQRGLSFRPDAMIAVGDHVYWDQRTWLESSSSRTREFVSRLYRSVGMLDRSLPAYGGTNEKLLKIVAGEQITPLYGTELRSTPSYFINDDHDYFENDEATDRYVTLPPEPYQKHFFEFVRNHYLPDFLPVPGMPGAMSGAMSNGHNRYFGALRWGQLNEVLMYDCAGHLTLKGETAGLVPADVERWLLARTSDESIAQLLHIPSHPFGWSAGKWREWYPDVADTGKAGAQTAKMGADGEPFKLTTGKPKFMWQKGWWHQHQRLLASLTKQRRRPGIVLSGDLHATGHAKIVRSGKLSLAENPVHSIITGPLGTGSGWASRARGTPPMVAGDIQIESPAPVTERNGFTLLDIKPEGVRVRLFAWRREVATVDDIDSLEPYHDVTISRDGVSQSSGFG